MPRPNLLPTLVELARDGAPGDYATPLEGRSLLPHLASGSGHDEARGEYFAEGVDTPMYMLRRGALKLIQADGDPAQCFDLASDPDERHNLAAAPEPSADVAALLGDLPDHEERARLTATGSKASVDDTSSRRSCVRRGSPGTTSRAKTRPTHGCGTACPSTNWRNVAASPAFDQGVNR